VSLWSAGRVQSKQRRFAWLGSKLVSLTGDQVVGSAFADQSDDTVRNLEEENGKNKLLQ
jgi:hypothetical protein